MMEFHLVESMDEVLRLALDGAIAPLPKTDGKFDGDVRRSRRSGPGFPGPLTSATGTLAVRSLRVAGRRGPGATATRIEPRASGPVDP